MAIHDHKTENQQRDHTKQSEGKLSLSEKVAEDL